MSPSELESRVAELEREVARLKACVESRSETPGAPWWKRIAGTFADDPIYEEAMALGRQYRESLGPPEPEESGESMD